MTAKQITALLEKYNYNKDEQENQSTIGGGNVLQ